MTAGLPFIYTPTLLAKIVLLPLGLSTGMSPAEAVIRKTIHRSRTTELMISNEEMEDVMKIIK